VSDIGHSREDEWFRKNERELIENARRAREAREKEREAREKESERKRLRELHFMRCPKCGHEMVEQVVESITVDRCTFCEGLYLDANEVEQSFLRRPEENRGLLRKLIGI
jgi:hypothetical protein